MKNVVLVSTHCPFSEKFLNLIGSYPPIRDAFVYYRTDPDPVTKHQNVDLIDILEVEKTPTLYFNCQKYVGKRAFQWLKQQIHNLHAQQQQPPPQERTNVPEYAHQGGVARAQPNSYHRGPPPPLQTRANANANPLYPSTPSQQQPEPELQGFAPSGGGTHENFVTFDNNTSQYLSNIPGPPAPGNGFNEATRDGNAIRDVGVEQLIEQIKQERAKQIPQPVQRQ